MRESLPTDPSRLAAARRALFEALLAKQGLAAAEPPPIPQRSTTDPPPLSFAQQRLWFLDQLAPHTAIYNNPSAVRLRGPLAVAALDRSLQLVVQRHEILRTTFTLQDGQLVQRIAPALPIALSMIDLQPLAEPARAAELQRLADAEARTPFPLDRGPLLRATLIQLAAAEHILVLNLHHTISDGWSMGVLLRELMTLYEDCRSSRPASLPELSIQYADFAIWQRAWLAGAGSSGASPLQRQLAYWTHQLADLAVLELPTDRPRALVETFPGAVVPVAIPPQLTAALNALAQREGATLFMTVLTAFQILLHRYSGQADIVVGAPIAGRTRAELHDLIGVFVNMLVLRADCSGAHSFRSLLQQVRTTALDAYAHQDLPFERLVDELHPARSLSQTPLVQVVLAFQNVPLPELAAGELALDHVDIHSGTAKFDLTLTLHESGAGIDGMIEYNTNLFDAATIERLASHFQTLLEGAVADPDQLIADLSLLTPAEEHQILVDWNTTAAAYPGDQLIHDLFEDQVKRRPDALAATGDDGHVTYQALDRQANQLAHQLRALGVRAGTPVAIYLNRSLGMIVGLLGILKAGGFYVPIDPTWPDDRTRWILASIKARCIVTQMAQLPLLRAIQAQLPDLTDLICLDLEAPHDPDATHAPYRTWPAQDLRRLPEHRLPASATPEDIAYIIYTSGSTGVPKGVVVRHKPVINLIDWVNRTYQTGPGDQILFVASLCFDLSVYDIFGLLAAGGSIRIVAEPELVDPERLFQILCDEPITFWDSAPAALRQLTAYFPATAPQQPLGRLRLVFLSGDWIPVTLPDRVRGAFAGAHIIALGGATEATIWSNYYPIGEVDPLWLSIPYGKPIQNARYYILDARMRPCPIGIPGDLCIGGECLADGYANAPAQTAAQFVPDPFAHTPGARLYKTGDRARFRADGTIEFLGRIDHQVKVRGFRIELGEIQVVLGQHPAVRESVIVADGDTISGKRLIAYVVPREGPAPTMSELRRHLQARLPDYMVPAAFILLERIPLTPNGKVDRRALPAPDGARPELAEAFVAPRSQAEQTLASIWADLLQLEQVGVYDNFFALGGDSILSMQVITRANQAGLAIAPRQLFLNQTIAELAAVVGTAQPIVAEQGVVTGTLPLTPIQRWFFEQHLPEPHHWNQAVLLEVRQRLSAAQWSQIVGRLLSHHDALRLRATRAGSDWQLRNADRDEVVPFAWLDLAALPEDRQRSAFDAAAAELQASLNLTDGPLIRVVFVDLGAVRSGRFLIVVHHLAIDGVSWRILLDDLQTAFGQLNRGEPIQLPAKTTSFQAWAERLVAHARSDTLHRELAYWQGLPWSSVCHLPVDMQGGANTEAQAATISVTLDAQDTQALLQHVPEAYNTQINDALLTALAHALARWTGEQTVLVDLEGHGREALFDDMDLSRTVGWFTTIFPVLLDLGNHTAPDAQLKAVKEQLRAIPQHGMGYGMLRYLNDDPAIAAFMQTVARAEIVFNFLGQFAELFHPDSPFHTTREAAGSARSPRGPRLYLLEVDALVIDGELHMNWTYSEQLYRRATIDRLAQDVLAALRTLIADCQTPNVGRFTSSDFPLAGLDQPGLDRLLGQLADDDAEE